MGELTAAGALRDPQAEQDRLVWMRWRLVALLVGFSFLTWFNRVSMSVAYDERIQQQSGISPEAMGYVYSAFLFVYMVFMTPGGWLIDRFGTKMALAVMGLGSALFGALTAVAGHPMLLAAGLVFPALLLIRSAMGMLSAPIYPAASRAVAQWVPPQRRAWANGLVQAAAAVGIACAFPIFGSLIDWLDWPSAFLLSGGVTALMAILWIVYAADSPSPQSSLKIAEPSSDALRVGVPRWKLPGSPETLERSPWRLLRNRSLMLLTLIYATVGYVEYLFFFWMHYYFENVLGMGKEASRGYATILFLAMAGGMIFGGFVSDWLVSKGQRSRGLVPAVGMVVGAGCLILGLLAQETFWIVTWLALALAAVGACEAPVWTAAVELGGRLGGTAAGICNTGGNAGGLVAPIVTPLVSGWVSYQFAVSEPVGWQWGIALGSLFGLLGACLWWWVTPADLSNEKNGS